jgi:hypothetical protein
MQHSVLPEQRSLFDTDPAAELSRALVDIAYDVVLRRTWLDDRGITRLYSELALLKNALDLECLRAEQLSRGIQVPKRAYRTRRVAATQH